MSFRMEVKVEKVLEDGSYQALLDSVEEVETKYGNRLMWRFSVPQENVRVVGFTSMSPSTSAKAYQWAEALMGKIDHKRGWGPGDVEGKPCTVVLETYEDDKGIEKNKVVRVKPVRTGESADSAAKADSGPEDEFDSLPF
jgi:hypothetical protein